jgi:hypothetical protein
MNWRYAFEPWAECSYSENVAVFINSFGFRCIMDGDEVGFISEIEDSDGDWIYNREDNDWEDIENHLPNTLITLLNAVLDWSSPVTAKGKRKTIVGSMAKLPLP